MNRELDAKVAEVMGDDLEKCAYCGDARHRHSRPPSCMDFRMRMYSCDPYSCAEVKAECRRRGWWYKEGWDDLTKNFSAVVVDVANYGLSKRSQEEAFCLAFLAAVESERFHARSF